MNMGESINCFFGGKSALLTLNLIVPEEFLLLEKFSTFTKLKRVTAFILRFIHNCKNKNNHKTGALQVNELDEALSCLIKVHQNRWFKTDLKNLKKGKLPSDLLLPLS